MKKIISILLVLVLSIGFFTACGSKNDKVEPESVVESPEDNEPVEATEDESDEMVTITHRGGTTQVPLNPKKVVVMEFGMLDTIDKLGIDAELAIPANNLPAYLEKYKDTALNIGGLKEYDMEAIHSFEPDLIIVGGRQQDNVEAFEEIAPTIVLTPDNARYFDSAIENIKNIGIIFGKEDQVESELAGLNDKIAQIAETASQENMNTLIMLTNEGGMSVYGPGSRFGIIHDTFGFPPVDDSIEESTHGQEINYEYISKFNPDYIFVIDRTAAIGGEILASKTLDNPLVNSTNAAENDHIIMLDPDIWYLSGGGLASINLMVDEVLANI